MEPDLGRHSCSTTGSAPARELPLSREAQTVRAEVVKVCEAVFEKLPGPDADSMWARQVYLALLGEAAHAALPDSEPDALTASQAVPDSPGGR
ncbi:hypothetical protein [Microbispora sp. NPDC046933]|uniref:hypothetical protein n=1 Tax=Microbispora sp. NPDC046933 TaxID=3155618 RepID=UPI0034034DE0